MTSTPTVLALRFKHSQQKKTSPQVQRLIYLMGNTDEDEGYGHMHEKSWNDTFFLCGYLAIVAILGRVRSEVKLKKTPAHRKMV